MKRISLLIIAIIGILLLTSCERKYYTVTKSELEQMEKRVIRIESRITDLLYRDGLPYNSEAYSKVEEMKEEADALINDIGCIIDADRNN